MWIEGEPPSWESFLEAPLAQVARIAPQSVVYAAAGTRRDAALAGLSTDSDEYAQWSRARMVEACALIFEHGVDHIFTILAAPGQFAEIGPYRKKLVEWIRWGVAGPEAMANYRRHGWRVRLVCDDANLGLHTVQTQLSGLDCPAATSTKTLWYIVAAEEEAAWRAILAAAARPGVQTRADAIRALYGEDVPLISLYLGFGKPTITPDLLPPLLMGKVRCYWTQRPGYELSAVELRAILYDYAFLRDTWRSDKSGRGDLALRWRTAWQRGPILGLGARLGPFWYPQPFAWPSESGDAIAEDGACAS